MILAKNRYIKPIIQDAVDRRVGLVIGDSIARGHDSVDTAPDYLSMATVLTSLTGFNWVNHGINSKTTSDWVVPSYWTSYVVDGVRNNVLFHLGVNDIYFAIDMETRKANYKLLFDKFRNLGYKIIVMSVPYSNRDIAKWSEVDTINAWLITECAKRGIWFVDYSAWSKAQKDNATYYGDTIHPAKAGYIYMANQVYNEVFNR